MLRLMPQQQQPQQGFHPDGNAAANALQFLDATVNVRTASGETFLGEVFSLDANNNNFLVLRQRSSPNSPVCNLRMIKLQHIVEIAAVAAPPPNPSTFLPSCNPRVLEDREVVAVAEFNAHRANIGVGVTQEAQEIFDFINKTHGGCSWDGKDCISVQGVTIAPPYTEEDLTGPARPLERIAQVLQKYRQRRESRVAAEEAAVAAVAPQQQQPQPPPRALGFMSGPPMVCGPPVAPAGHPYDEHGGGYLVQAGRHDGAATHMAPQPQQVALFSPQGAGGTFMMMVVPAADEKQQGFYAPVYFAGNYGHEQPAAAAASFPPGPVMQQPPPANPPEEWQTAAVPPDAVETNVQQQQQPVVPWQQQQPQPQQQQQQPPEEAAPEETFPAPSDSWQSSGGNARHKANRGRRPKRSDR